MKKAFVLAMGVVGSMAIAGGALADGSFQDHYSDCVDRFASTSVQASVMLECTADSGKLGGCKVVDNSAPGKGFDKAAMCVAGYLPMGGKTGTVRVPIRFAGA
jgi:hypothetical protein